MRMTGSTLKGAFALKQTPAPWRRLWGTGLTTALVVGAGLAVGHWQWGVWAFMGGFASLYVRDQSYRSRAVTLALVGLGLTASMGLGARSAIWWISALSLAFVAGASTFVAETFDLPLPSAFMFILVACISAALPLGPATAVSLRMSCVAGGGAVAWLVGLMDWLWDPRGPASRNLANAFQSLASYAHKIHRGQRAARTRSDAAAAIRTAQRTAGLGRDRRLQLGADAAGKTFRALMRLSTKEKPSLPPPWPQLLASMARQIRHPAKHDAVKQSRPPTNNNNLPENEWRPLRQSALEASAATFTTKPQLVSNVYYPRFTTRLGKSLYPQVLVLPAALRIGLAVLISVTVAHFLGITHPFWVPLTCAAVLQGISTTVMTRRSIQRVIGTTLGLILAGALLALHPTSILSALFIVILQLAMLYFIAKNYGISVLFITSLALVVIYSGTHAAAVPLMWARFKDTLLGAAVGLAAAFTLWRRASSAQLPQAAAETVQRTQRLMDVVLNGAGPSVLAAVRDQCLAALLTLRHLYENAIGEMEPLASTMDAHLILGVEQLGYVVLALPPAKRPDPDLADGLNAVWDTLKARCEGQSDSSAKIPAMPPYPGLANQLQLLLGPREDSRQAEK